MWIQLISVIKKRCILLFVMALCQWRSASSQIKAVDITVQLVPPYSSRIVDYVAPGNEKLRIIALQRDLTQASYSFFLRMEVSVNGQVLFRTSSNWQPPATTIAPGMPVILGGADLQPYFDANHLDFIHFNRDQYVTNPNLPEGYTSICFTAYDYGRPDVAVSQTNCGNYFLTLPDPPLLNYPACGMQVRALTPQQLTFSWMPMNMGNIASQSTVYELSLYENRDHRNPNDIVQSLPPIYKNRIQGGTMIYGPGEPALLTGMNYVWRVQAIDENGRQAFKNNGFSLPCEFTYSADSGYNWANAQPLQIYAKAMNETNAKIGWQTDKAVAYDRYTVYYRKKGNSNNWFNNTLTDTTYFLNGLEPNTSYETRVQGIKGVSSGVYSDIAGFTTPAKKVVDCKQAAGMLATYNGRPYLKAMRNDIVHYGSFEITLDKVQALQPGYYDGTGTVTVPFIAGMTFSVTFKNIQIDDEMQVTAGKVTFDSQGVNAWLASTPTVNTVIKNLSDAIKQLLNSSVKDNKDLLTQLETQIRALAQQELPESLISRLDSALQQMKDAKTGWDAARKAYDNSTTGEVREDAKAKMDEAEKKFNNAKQTVDGLQKEKETLINNVAGVIITAIKNIKADNESDFGEINKYQQERKTALNDLYSSQGLDTTRNENEQKPIDVFVFIEDKTLDGDEQTAFIQKSKGFRERLKKVKGIVVYKAFTNFFTDEKAVAGSLLSDKHISAKALVDQLIQKQRNGETKENMIQFAHDYLTDELKKYIDTLTN
jgi:hypothetical protein